MRGRASCGRVRPTWRSFVVALGACALALPFGSVPVESKPEASAPLLHYLPFPVGVTYKVFQGNDQRPSHHDQWNKHAYDFSPMPVSAPVCATADGTVVYVKEDTVGPTGNSKDNNEVSIRHADGTVGVYVHLEKDGALVEVGDVVYAGDVVGRAGNTGKSTARHLHFALKAGRRLGPTVPCRFVDVPGDGVPDTGETVTSANVAGRRLHEVVGTMEAAYDDACVMDAREAVTSGWKNLHKRPPRAVTLALDALERRKDFVASWERRRDALLERHQAEAQRLQARLTVAVDSGALVEAAYLATIGKKEFADLEIRKALTAAHKALRAAEGYGEAEKAARPRLALRTLILGALTRDLENQAKEARGKRVRWASALRMYDKALEAARAAGAEAIVERLTRRKAEAAQRAR